MEKFVITNYQTTTHNINNKAQIRQDNYQIEKYLTREERKIANIQKEKIQKIELELDHDIQKEKKFFENEIYKKYSKKYLKITKNDNCSALSKIDTIKIEKLDESKKDLFLNNFKQVDSIFKNDILENIFDGIHDLILNRIPPKLKTPNLIMIRTLLQKEIQVTRFTPKILLLKTNEKKRSDEILTIDCPERLIKRIKKTDKEQLLTKTLQEEAIWILQKGFGIDKQGHTSMEIPNKYLTNCHFNTKTNIISVIEWIRKQCLDVPYIILQMQDQLPIDYRKDIKGLKRDLWIIDQLDQKWQIFFLKRRTIIKSFEHYSQSFKKIYNLEIKNSLEICQEMSELEDFETILNTYNEKTKIKDSEISIISKNIKTNNFQSNDLKMIQTDLSSIVNRMAILTLENRKQKTKIIEEIQTLYNCFKKKIKTNKFEKAIDIVINFKKIFSKNIKIQTKIDFGTKLNNIEMNLFTFFSSLKKKIIELKKKKRKEKEEKEVTLKDLIKLKNYYKQLIFLIKSKSFNKKKFPKRTINRNHRKKFNIFYPLLTKIGNLKKLCYSLNFSLCSVWSNSVPYIKETLNDILEEIRLNTSFRTVSFLRKALIYSLSKRISLEPQICQHFRKKILLKGFVFTEPTYKGKCHINWIHPFASIRRLKRMPLKEFKRVGCNQWIFVEEAQKQSLLKCRFEMPKSKWNSYSKQKNEKNSSIVCFFMNELIERFCSNKQVQWDLIRKQILKKAVTMYLIPKAIKSVKMKMREWSIKVVIHSAKRKFQNICQNGFLESKHKIIMTCVIGGIYEPSYFCIIDENGDIHAYLTLHFLKTNINITNRKKLQQRSLIKMKYSDTHQFKQFVNVYKPNFIGIDASGSKSLTFMKEIRAALIPFKTTNVQIILINPLISRIYQFSEKASREFNNFPSGMRMAVSLGRYCINPISEISNIWYYDRIIGINNILTLPLNPDTRFIPNDILIQSLYPILIQEVCDIGISVNVSIHREHYHGMFQFISGLGIKRGKHLLGQMLLIEKLISRDVLLLSEKNPDGIFSQTIWNNVIPFLRITLAKDMTKSIPISLFDSMLIHPLNYEYGEIVITSALDLNEQNPFDSNNCFSEEKLKSYKIEKINKKIDLIRTKNQYCVENLNLEAFANQIQKTEKKKILLLLHQIKNEIKSSFHENRPKLKNLKNFPNELFELLSGESERTLVQGMLLTCKIYWFNYAGIKCGLNGLNCWIPIYNAEDSFYKKITKIDNKYKNNEIKKKEERKLLLTKKFKEGSFITGRIIELNKTHMVAKLSLLKKDVYNTLKFELPYKGSSWLIFHHPDDSQQKAINNDKLKNTSQKHFINRQINFKYFKNISREETEEILAEKDVGSIIIRPSSRSIEYLCLSWKMTDEPDIIVHFKIEEKQKPNPFAIGKKLIIENEIYNELDELVAMFVDRLNDLKQTIVSLKQFKFGTEEDIKELLYDEKNDKPLKIPYAISYSYKQPGRFVLSCILSKSTLQQEYISLTYRGYRFRGIYFPTPLHLIYWFKCYPNRKYRTYMEIKNKKKYLFNI